MFNKRGKTSDPYKPRYETDGRIDRLGFPQGLRGPDSGDESEVQRFLQQKQQERELEDLLVKMDDTRNVCERNLSLLSACLFQILSVFFYNSVCPWNDARNIWEWVRVLLSARMFQIMFLG